jgi:inner membrane transporter RhtA
VRSGSARALLWPALALVGVLGLTEPWHGEVDPAGVLFAGLGAVGWGAFLVLTQHVGDRQTGLSVLSVTVPVAALTAAVPSIPQAAGHLSLGVLATAAGLALLFPALQYALDLLGLRHMTQSAFGTLMALEPAVGVLLGLVVPFQQPSPVQLVGMVLPLCAAAIGPPPLPPSPRPGEHRPPRPAGRAATGNRAGRAAAGSVTDCTSCSATWARVVSLRLR